MVETLLSPSNILLYGRVLQDLKFEFVRPPKTAAAEVKPDKKNCESEAVLTPPDAPPRLGANNFLEDQLAEQPVVVRVYGYSFEGHYYDMAKPAIFLLHGPGSDPEAFRPGLATPEARVSRAPADADRTGVAGQDGSFSEDMRVWSYDKGDFSIRMDTESGSFEEILLGSECGGTLGAYSGMDARIRSSGMDARTRSSGMDARIRSSGMDARGRSRGD